MVLYIKLANGLPGRTQVHQPEYNLSNMFQNGTSVKVRLFNIGPDRVTYRPSNPFRNLIFDAGEQIFAEINVPISGPVGHPIAIDNDNPGWSTVLVEIVEQGRAF